MRLDVFMVIGGASPYTLLCEHAVLSTKIFLHVLSTKMYPLLVCTLLTKVNI